jgi:hypothetical protein
MKALHTPAGRLSLMLLLVATVVLELLGSIDVTGLF